MLAPASPLPRDKVGEDEVAVFLELLFARQAGLGCSLFGRLGGIAVGAAARHPCGCAREGEGRQASPPLACPAPLLLSCHGFVPLCVSCRNHVALLLPEGEVLASAAEGG